MVVELLAETSETFIFRTSFIKAIQQDNGFVHSGYSKK